MLVALWLWIALWDSDKAAVGRLWGFAGAFGGNNGFGPRRRVVRAFGAVFRRRSEACLAGVDVTTPLVHGCQNNGGPEV